MADAAKLDESRSEGGTAVADAPPAPDAGNKNWYVVKIQSGREDTIKAALERRFKIEGLDAFLGEIIVPGPRSSGAISGSPPNAGQ